MAALSRSPWCGVVRLFALSLAVMLLPVRWRWCILACVAPLAVYAAWEPAQMPVLALIPTNISDTCTTLLTQLNDDHVFQSCTQPLIEATSAFANQTVSGNATGVLSHTLDDLCATNHGCDRPLVQQFISQFWDSCSDELESRDPDVTQLYDYLYIFNPFRDAICTKDEHNQYCLASMGTGMSTQADMELTQLYRRSFLPEDVPNDPYSDAYWDYILPTIPRSSTKHATANTTVLAASMPDVNQLPDLSPQQLFFFLSNTTNKAQLCTRCSQSILASYIAFEMASPYALGIESSPVLQSQQSIYDHARKTCGDSFVQQLNQEAGVQAFSEPASSALHLHAPYIPIMTVAVVLSAWLSA